MSGHVGNFSADQERILAEFKQMLSDVHRPEYDDYFYSRWLRARNFDKLKAESMLRKHLAWRKKIGAETILNDYKVPEVLDKYYPRSFLGADKEGCPVRYLPFRNLDFRGFALTESKAEIVKYLVYLHEEETHFMKEQTDKLGKKVENSTYIVDIEGYTFKQATNRQSVDTLNTLLRVFEQNYPERLRRAYFINIPVYFSMVLALSKPFISEATLKKFKFFGRDDFRDFLPTEMDPEILPAFLGGKRTDPDGNPRCHTIIQYGGFVPKSYYYIHRDLKFVDEDGVKCMLLPKRSWQLIEKEVVEVGSRLQWEVETLNYDIGVGLYYWKTSGDTCGPHLEEIIPIERINSHLVPESCSHICDCAGTYVIKFDNSYSWFFQKKIMYRITITRPSQLETELSPG